MANFTPLSAAIGGALIGLAAVMLMLSPAASPASAASGRQPGLGSVDRAWRLAFIAGLILAPVAAMLAGYRCRCRRCRRAGS